MIDTHRYINDLVLKKRCLNTYIIYMSLAGADNGCTGNIYRFGMPCDCEKDHIKDNSCFYCKGTVGRHHFYQNCYANNLPKKYMCFNCNIIWKGHIYPKVQEYTDREIDKGILGDKDNYGGDRRCCKCGKWGRVIPHTIRAPKQKDKKAWECLRKVLTTDFSDYPDGSKGIELTSSIATISHFSPINRAQFWIPQRLQDYDRWLEEMKKPFKYHNVHKY